MEKNVEIGILYEYYGSLLSEKQADTIENYYLEDLSLTEIAELQGVSKQNVSESLKRSEKALEEFEEKLQLYKRFLQVQEGFDGFLELIRQEESDEKYQRYSSMIKDIMSKLN